MEGRGKIWKKECSKILHFKIRFKIQILDSEFKSAEKKEHFFEHLNFKFERAEEEKRNGGNFETFEDIILIRSSKIWFSFKFERGETFEDATCLKIGSRWKVFRKSGRKKEWKVEVWEEIRVLCRSNWTNLTRNNVALEIKKRRFKAYWPPSASKRAGDLELLEQTFCTVFLHRLCRMCERGGESHYGIVQEELKRKGKKKRKRIT